MEEKTNGTTKSLYWGGASIILLFLIAFPIIDLIFGKADIPGIWNQVVNGVNGQGDELTSMDGIKNIFISILAIFSIGFVVFTPTSNFKSPLYFSGMHSLKAINDLTDTKSFSNDPSALRNIMFKLGVYGLVTLGIFVMYYYLILQIINAIILSQGSVIAIIVLLINILVVSLGNSYLVMFLEKKDPAHDFVNGKLVMDDNKLKEQSQEDKNKENTILWGIVLILINIVILGKATDISSWADNTLNNSAASVLIEGNATSIDDIKGVFNE